MPYDNGGTTYATSRDDLQSDHSYPAGFYTHTWYYSVDSSSYNSFDLVFSASCSLAGYDQVIIRDLDPSFGWTRERTFYATQLAGTTVAIGTTGVQIDLVTDGTHAGSFGFQVDSVVPHLTLPSLVMNTTVSASSAGSLTLDPSALGLLDGDLLVAYILTEDSAIRGIQKPSDWSSLTTTSTSSTSLTVEADLYATIYQATTTTLSFPVMAPGPVPGTAATIKALVLAWRTTRQGNQNTMPLQKISGSGNLGVTSLSMTYAASSASSRRSQLITSWHVAKTNTSGPVSSGTMQSGFTAFASIVDSLGSVGLATNMSGFAASFPSGSWSYADGGSSYSISAHRLYDFSMPVTDTPNPEDGGSGSVVPPMYLCFIN